MEFKQKPTMISITNELIDLHHALEDLEGELPLELELRLSEVLAEDKKKVTNYVLLLNSYDAEISFTKERISEAEAYVKRLENAQNKLLGIARQAIDLRGENLEGEMGKKIYIRKSSETIVNVAPEKLPLECQTFSVSANKKEIKAKLEAGEEIPGCHIQENKNVVYK